jgi:hypothetical protein
VILFEVLSQISDKEHVTSAEDGAGMLNTLYAALLADGRKDHAGGGLSTSHGALHPHNRPQGT